jgi:exosortase family protein XrtF
LKKYFIQYKPFLLFLGKFLLSYLILTFLYQTYLNQFESKQNELDGFTQSVTSQSVAILSLFDNQTYSMPHLKEPSMKFFYHGKYVSRMVEGCNGISVIILFASFILSFSGRLAVTIVYIISGSVLIHLLNLIRIILLNVALFHLPQFEHLLHDVLFPLFIYGFVFFLWVIWVNKFSFYATKTAKE